MESDARRRRPVPLLHRRRHRPLRGERRDNNTRFGRGRQIPAGQAVSTSYCRGKRLPKFDSPAMRGISAARADAHRSGVTVKVRAVANVSKVIAAARRPFRLLFDTHRNQSLLALDDAGFRPASWPVSNSIYTACAKRLPQPCTAMTQTAALQHTSTSSNRLKCPIWHQDCRYLADNIPPIRSPVYAFEARYLLRPSPPP